MINTTLGQLLINEQLPPDIRDYSRVLDKKGVQGLMREVAQKYPDDYRDIAKKLSDVGRTAAVSVGGHSFGIDELRTTVRAKHVQQELRAKLREIYTDPRLGPKQRQDKMLETVSKYQSTLADEVLAEAKEVDNPLARQLLGAGRGNKFNLNSLIGADLLYVDQDNKVIPLPVLYNYSQGFLPADYFAASYGARKGLIDLKSATQDAGFFCLAEGTAVRLANGESRAIEAIRVGDTVLGADVLQHTFPVRVSAVFNHGPKAVWRYTFRAGKARNADVVISATEDHKVLAAIANDTTNAVTTRPLGNGKNLRLVLPRDFYDFGLLHEERSGILGLLLSEGGLTGNNITFSTADMQFLQVISQQLATLGMRCRIRNNKQYEYTIYDEEPNRREAFRPLVSGERRHRLWQWLDTLALSGMRSYEKKIPNIVNSWDNASVAMMLGWLFEGDGCVAETNCGRFPILVLGMTSAAIVQAVRDLLSFRFGIHTAPVRRRAASKIPGAQHDCFYLQIATRTSVARFVETIPMPGVKGNKLRRLWDAATPSVRNDSEFRLSFVRREFIGMVNTYDIEVDHPDHLFVLDNGAIVSNSKQLSQAAHRLVVTADDDDEADPGEAVLRGYSVETDDADNVGALLAAPVGEYPRNTELTPKILKELRNSGVKHLLVRSPIVGGPRDGGVYSRDVGRRERGMAPIGDFTGLAAAQALSEPVTQSQISSKHCLAAGTLVRMADRSTKRIEDICEGDEVLGADKSARTFPSRVVRTYDNGKRECVLTQFLVPYSRKATSIELRSTADHKVLMFRCGTNTLAEVDNWTPQVLPVGTPAGRLTAITPNGFCDVNAEPTPIGELPTYDIEVDNDDHLFVLANGLIVSNSGGVAGASAGAISGFPLMNALVQVPKTFRGGAAHAQLDGRVDEIVAAPQGGHYVTVAGQRHYVGPDAVVTAKVGGMVEAGDTLSSGVPSPAEITKHKGIGEGRVRFVELFRNALRDANTYGNRRNIELLTRGLINHVRLTDELGDWAPDDVVPYQSVERLWKPRMGATAVDATQALGKYLEKPVLHYTIGTKIRPSMLPLLQRHNVAKLTVHESPPPFEPEMIRGMANVANDQDWAARMLGSYQQRSLLSGVHRVDSADEAGTSYVPALMRGADFGISGKTKSW